MTAPWSRPLRPRAGRMVALALLAAVLAACGGSNPATVPAGTPSSGPPPSSEPPNSEPQDSEPPNSEPPSDTPTLLEVTVLEVTVDDGAGSVTTRTLTCDPPGGDVPDPEAACAAVSAAGAGAFAPVAKDAMCTSVFGGPQQATVTGTVGGRPVAAAFQRTNGCEISRWDALAPLLGRIDAGS